jgi:hypothetical protein
MTGGGVMGKRQIAAYRAGDCVAVSSPGTLYLTAADAIDLALGILKHANACMREEWGTSTPRGDTSTCSVMGWDQWAEAGQYVEDMRP